MCGIFSLFNYKLFSNFLLIKDDLSVSKNDVDSLYNEHLDFYEKLQKLFMNGKGRGPEFNTLNFYEDIASFLGFHRLAINGLDENSHQPLYIHNNLLICNGEIYNYKHIYETLDIKPQTNSDCEVIIYLYEKYGIERCLQLLDGVFAFVLIDMNNIDNIKIHVARDPQGIRPLYEFSESKTSNEVYGDENVSSTDDYYNDILFCHQYKISMNTMKNIQCKYGKLITNMFGFSSEMKMVLNNDINNYVFNPAHINIRQFQPGTYKTFQMRFIRDIYSKVNIPFITMNTSKSYYTPFNFHGNIIKDKSIALQMIKHSLEEAVYKRVITTDRPIACLLSGGLDSSLITALVNKIYSKKYGKTMETYSIGLKGSVDLYYAKKVAEHLGTKHNEIIVEEENFLNAIPEVIYAIESYDTTTVRASTGNYLVSKYISENSDAKVIFNGDGADELFGGYLYFHCSPNSLEFDNECKRLLNDIHYFDVLRSDRSISSNGLEARTPFLDKSFIQTYLSICRDLRFYSHRENCEKNLIREAFSGDDLLPHEVLWRTKEAFSDGVSSNKKSWYEIIQGNCEKNNDFIKEQYYDAINDSYFSYDSDDLSSKNSWKMKNLKIINKPMTKEQVYYRNYFHKYFGFYNDNVIPYFWMPKFIENARDSSARTLDIYKEKMNKKC